MDDTTHELLLRLAGRVDDDLLADAREFVAVGEDGQALELVTAALAADAAVLPPAVRAELVTAAATARIDLDADAALAPAAPDTTAHRFSASADDDVPVVAAVRELPGRLRDGIRMRLAWRQTPAGPAPMPLPFPVLLVERPADGRPSEVLAYQVGTAMARSGMDVAVEVLTAGRPLTTYHAAALRDSTPLTVDAPPRPAAPPEKMESVVAEVVEEVSASHRAAAQEGSVDLFAADEEPAPRPVPMRAWQSGRRRRGFGEQAVEAESDDEVPEAAAPLPNPVPLARRTRPRLVGEAKDPLGLPFADERAWTEEWASGDWAVADHGAQAGDPAVAPDVDLRESTKGSHALVVDPGERPRTVSAVGPHAEAPKDPHATDGETARPPGTPRPAHIPTASEPNTPADQVDPVRPGAAEQHPPAEAPSGYATGQPEAVAADPDPAESQAVPTADHGVGATDGVASLDESADPGAERPSTSGPAHALADPPTGALGPPAEALLTPEAFARLSDANRELLTRLQAELAGGGAPGPYPSGANGNGGPA